jgi:hypothetical protein
MSSAPLFLFADNVSTVLASSLDNSTTTVVTADASAFPNPSAGQRVAVTVEDVSGNIEVMYCTAVSGNNLTVVRAEEGTGAQAFASGSRVEMRVTAGVLNSFLQKLGNDTMSGTTDLTGVLALTGSGSIQGGEFTGALRGGPGNAGNEITVPSDDTSPPTVAGSVILTEANVVANLPTGYGFVPSLAVIMWSGASNAIPAGYLICDGSLDTPDLTDHFVVAAGNLYGLGSAGGTGIGDVTGTTDAHGATGVTISPVTLGANNLPVHKHPFDYFFGSNVAVVGDPAYGAPGGYIGGFTGAGVRVSYAGAPNAAPNAVAFTPAVASIGSHTHTFTATSPPYYGLFFIMKS